jgi:multicomponent Na+:H+ antiporter subunit E
MRALALNTLIAVVWLLLQSEATAFTFVAGFALGFGLIAIFRGPLDGQHYVRRVMATFAFAGIFAREFLLSSWQIARLVLLTRPERLRPSMIRYDIEGLTKAEILLLTHCISLTPGTTTVDIDDDFRSCTLHVLDGEPAAVRESIDRTLRAGILAFTR